MSIRLQFHFFSFKFLSLVTIFNILSLSLFSGYVVVIVVAIFNSIIKSKKNALMRTKHSCQFASGVSMRQIAPLQTQLRHTRSVASDARR